MRIQLKSWILSLPLAIGFSTSLPSLAEEAVEEPVDTVGLSPEEKGWTPPFRTTAFKDRVSRGDCHPIDARYGRCIDVVDFVDYSPPWIMADRWKNIGNSERATLLHLYPTYHRKWLEKTTSEKSLVRNDDFARMTAYGSLFAQTWEDIAYRWRDDEDAIIASLKSQGFQLTPTPSKTWDYLSPYGRRSFSLPEKGSWLSGSDWVQPVLPVLPTKDLYFKFIQKKTPIFRLVKYSIPKSHFSEPIPAVLMKGRFAQRLGFENRAHDYDLMDGDPKSSGPFFEQVFPYQTIYRADDLSHIPLKDFKYPDIEVSRDPSMIKNVLPVKSLIDAHQHATRQFGTFYRMVATQVMQFSMQDYTDNHMRILGSLTLMRTPPGSLAEATGIARNLNASAQGQTDSAELQNSQMKASPYSVPGGFRLNYGKIPQALLVEWLERLDAAHNTKDISPLFYRELTNEAVKMFGDLLKTRTPTYIENLTDVKLKEWVSNHAGTGTELNVLLDPLRVLALEMKMSSLKQSLRDVEETWLLLDHLNYAIASNMDDTLGQKIAPADLTGLTSGQWEKVLGDHYYSTNKISQGLGAIDPTAVCTTKDRLEALSEPSVGSVLVDQLFEGDDNQKNQALTNEDLLWSARDKLPFLMLDNPDANGVDMERLVGLPDGKALYRARWKVWSGWHLLWGVEMFADSERLTLRTAAICDDMVLTHPDLAATIIRAGFLEGEMLHTQPVNRADLAGRSDYPGAPEVNERIRGMNKIPGANVLDTRTEILNAAGNALSKTLDVAKEVGEVKEFVENPSLSSANLNKAAEKDLGSRGLGLSMDKRSVFGRKPIKIEVSDTAKYIQGFVRAPLEALAKEEGGLIVTFFDSAAPDSGSFWGDIFPRTPYLKLETQSQFGRHIETKAWSLFFDKDIESQKVINVSPAYKPTDAFVAGAPLGGFKRNESTDVTFAVDAGMYPVRTAYFKCNENVNKGSLGSIERCEDGDVLTTSTEGFSFGFSSYTTNWIFDDPRMAWEGGFEIHIDMLHSGTTWFHTDSPPDSSFIVDKLKGKDVVAPSNVSPNYSWSFRPQTGASFGFRHALDPGPLTRTYFQSPPWGADGATGVSELHRDEWGVRGGMLIGPGYNGLEGTLVADIWWARSIRSNLSPWANFTAYHPIVNSGLYLRYQYGFMLLEDSGFERLYSLIGSNTILVGWRGHFRLPEKRPE